MKTNKTDRDSGEPIGTAIASDRAAGEARPTLVKIRKVRGPSEGYNWILGPVAIGGEYEVSAAQAAELLAGEGHEFSEFELITGETPVSQE